MRHIAGLLGLLVVTISLPLGACSSTHGPAQLRRGHLDYNNAVRTSVDDELLLNIVRLRYLDTIEFLGTSSISSQTEINVGLGATVGELGPEELAGVSGDVGWSARPTFTFTPQRGREFAERLLGPVDLNMLTHLAASNWPMDRLLRLFVTDLGPLNNNGIGEDAAAFEELSDLISALQSRGDIAAGFVNQAEPVSQPIPAARVAPADYVAAAEKGYKYVPSENGETLTLTKSGRRTAVIMRPGTPEAPRILELLELQPNERPYFTIDLGAHVGRPGITGDRIYIRTRSILTSMAHLARGVHVPCVHVAEGLARPDFPRHGILPETMDNFFQVHVSKNTPVGRLAVPYRGHWYSIADDDLESKLTFLILSTLYRLKLNDAAGKNTPVLTLPVGG